MKKVIKNYLYNFLYQMLVCIIPLIATPYISRVLGSENMGEYSYTMSITTYFSLFGCLGMNLYGQRTIASLKDDKQKQDLLFVELFIIRIISILVVFGLYLLLIIYYIQYRMFFSIQIFVLATSLIDISWYYQGLENFKITVFRNLFIKFLGLVLIFIFVKNKNDIYIYTFINVFISFLGNLFLWFKIRLNIQSLKVSVNDLFKHIHPIMILFIPQISATVYVVLDKVILGILSSNESEVTFYDQSQIIVKMIMSVVTSIGIVLMPRITFLFEKGNINKIKEYMEQTLQVVLMISLPIVCGIVCCSIGFVPWYFGSGFIKVAHNMMILSPIVLFIGVTSIIGTQYFIATNKQKEYTISIIIGGILNVSLNILLDRYFMSYGASIATCISECIVMIYQIVKTRYIFDYKLIISSSYKYFIGSIIMSFVLVFLIKILPASFLMTLIEVILGCMIYIVYLLSSKDKLLFMLIAKLATLISRKGETSE